VGNFNLLQKQLAFPLNSWLKRFTDLDKSYFDNEFVNRSDVS